MRLSLRRYQTRVIMYSIGETTPSKHPILAELCFCFFFFSVAPCVGLKVNETATPWCFFRSDMDDFRRTYQRLCKESGAEPQESVLTQLQEVRAAAGATILDLRGQSLTVESCSVLGKTLQKDALFTELLLSDCMLSEEGESWWSGDAVKCVRSNRCQ